MQIREAELADAPGIHEVLQQLVTAGLRTGPATLEFARDNYIVHPDNLHCAVAVEQDGAILGFQALKLAVEGNVYGVQPGWGIIGTHVSPNAARRGVGRALFATTRGVARNRGLSMIDASIEVGNVMGRAYYDAMGFVSYRMLDGRDCKSYRVV